VTRKNYLLAAFDRILRALVVADSIRDRRHWWLLTGYAAAIGISSLQVARPRIIDHSPSLHVLLHIFAFGTLCILATREVSGKRWELSIAFACFFFGVGIETAQHLLGAHRVEWNDVLDDGIGVGLAAWLTRAVRSALIERPFLKSG
jgi:VanZ family protein